MKTKSLKHFTSCLPASYKKAAFLICALFLTSGYCHAQNPVANFSVSDSIICAYDCITFTNHSTNDTAWQWYFPGGTPTSSTDQNPFVCYLNAGNYDVTLITSKGNKSDTLTLHNYIKVNPVPPPPVITQGYDTLYCSFDTSYVAYQWYSDSLLIPGATNTYLVVSYPGNYNIQVTNQFGCETAVGINIVFGNLPPIANFTTSNQQVCAGECIDFSNQSLYGNSYIWLFPGGTPSSSSAYEPSVCYNSQGSYDVTLIAINSNGTDTLSIPNYITVNPPIAFPVITSGNDTLFAKTDPSYVSYQWYLNGNSIPNATDTLLEISRNGNYTLQVYGSSGCSLTANFTYSLFPLKASFQASDSVVCANSCITFTNTSQNYTSSSWLFPGGTPSIDTAGYGWACYNTPGIYSVTLIISDGFTSDTLLINNYITVIPDPPVPVITHSNDTLFCSSDTSYKSYQWYNNNVAINGAIGSFLVDSTNNTTYQVEVKNTFGCVSTGSITVGAPITVNFYANDSLICPNTCINFTNQSVNATSWKWIFNGAAPPVSTDQNPQNICYLSGGRYDVTLIAMNGGYADTLTYLGYIDVNPVAVIPVITPSNDTLYCSTDPHYASYQWYLDSSLIPGATDTFLVIIQNGNYNILVHDIYGCSVASGINFSGGVGCTANFTINADTSQLHHYIVTNNATGVPPIRYYWSWGDGTHDTIPYPTHTYADSGFYTICLSILDSTACYRIFCDSSFHAMRTTNYMVSMTVVAPAPNGIQPMSLQTPQVYIYPNPVTNQLTIHASYFHNEAAIVSITNVLGQGVSIPLNVRWSLSEVEVDVSALSAGMYFIQLKSAGGSVVRKFVKE